MRSTCAIAVVFLSLLLVPLSVVVAKQQVEKDDMNDRFAIATGGATFDPPANCHVKTKLIQQGSISIQEVVIIHLGPSDYGVVVTVGSLADGCNPLVFNPQAVVESPPITVNAAGNFALKHFFVGNFPPGTYRVDILVVPAGNGAGGPFLLACQHFPCVTVE